VSPPPAPSPHAGAGAIALPPPSRLEELRSRGPLKRSLPLLGPAFVAAVAYVDPGNFATNIAGGAAHGYVLL
jgi:manganese transport protein